MREYWNTLMSVALLNGIVGMLSPEGDGKRVVRLLGSLCLICVMAQPMMGFLAEGVDRFQVLWDPPQDDGGVDYDEIYNQNLLNGGIENAERIIQSDIIKEFSLSEKAIEVDVSVEVKNDTMELTEVRLILRDESILTDPRELITYVNQRLLCPCIVVYD